MKKKKLKKFGKKKRLNRMVQVWKFTHPIYIWFLSEDGNKYK